MAGTVDKPLADVGDPGAVTLKGKRQERPSAPADDRTYNVIAAMCGRWSHANETYAGCRYKTVEPRNTEGDGNDGAAYT